MKLSFALLGITPIMTFITSYPHLKTLATISVRAHTLPPHTCNQAELPTQNVVLRYVLSITNHFDIILYLSLIHI